MRSNAPTELVAAMVRSPERPVALHAAAALHALTVGHVDGQVALQECGGIQVSNAVYSVFTRRRCRCLLLFLKAWPSSSNALLCFWE